MKVLERKKKEQKLFDSFLKGVLELDELSFLGVARFLNVPITIEEKIEYTEEEEKKDLAAEQKILEEGTEKEKTAFELRKKLTKIIEEGETRFKISTIPKDAYLIFGEILESFQNLTTRQKKNLIQIVESAKTKKEEKKEVGNNGHSTES
jgi:hypothetical protein